MKDIDEMDMIGFIKIRAWNANRKHITAPNKAYIDTVWPSMKANI